MTLQSVFVFVGHLHSQTYASWSLANDIYVCVCVLFIQCLTLNKLVHLYTSFLIVFNLNQEQLTIR